MPSRSAPTPLYTSRYWLLAIFHAAISFILRPMRIYVFSVFCLAIGIAPSFGLPAGDGNSSQNHQGVGQSSSGLIPHDHPPSYTTTNQPTDASLRAAQENEKRWRRQMAHEHLLREYGEGRYNPFPWLRPDPKHD
ncbi:hypothetical protein F5148DRAFT_459641 [Russula earlei]|uniref:Uncharacterized protein n=1 Tax=Russula earlei TaxID=71964 RepID=A0ACC0TZU6_9AGAM|nr:hypothetical protein F5148DRAFT_459641 [Russula earlei]